MSYSKSFIYAGLILLLCGLCFGLTGALQYLVPGFLKSYLSFEKIRPLHVSSMVFWILFSATGVVYTYLSEFHERKLFAPIIPRYHYYLFVFAVALILISYLMGYFGGREYWEFPPFLAIPVIAGWSLFLFNVVKTTGGFKNKPVYVWMWITGAVFFMFTYLESYSWLIPFIGKNLVHDMTIQWKSYGSMVGSWNMLIYGSSFYLMDKISGSGNYSRSKLAFLLYFLGLFNLMFNWGHHIYTLPAKPYVQYVSYAVSMTELLILGRIIYKWKETVSSARKYAHLNSYRFLLAADIWVFLTLSLAICMSVPVINVYTHGTHVTVAHTMGATIGINSFLLLAMVSDILRSPGAQTIRSKSFNRGFWMLNVSLFIFWLALIGAGIQKAAWALNPKQVAFGTMMKHSQPWFIAFFIGGLGIAVGFWLVVREFFRPNKNEVKLKVKLELQEN